MRILQISNFWDTFFSAKQVKKTGRIIIADRFRATNQWFTPDQKISIKKISSLICNLALWAGVALQRK